MGNTSAASEGAQDGDAVKTEITVPASEAQPDLQAKLAEAEAEAAEAEAAAAVARAKARAMRSRQKEEGEPAGEEDEDATSEPRDRLPVLPTVAKIVASVVIAAALAASGCILWQHHQVSVRQQHADEFIDTARQSVVDLTSVDYRTVKDQVQHIIDSSAGSFKDDFTARADQFIKVAEASKAVAKGTVSAAAVEKTTSDDEVVVLVVGNEQIANAAGNQQPRSFRFRVTVTRDGDLLKVSKLEMVL
jgi:Mce-associated membrane protein